MHLLHLRARWYAPETGTFLSVDPVESEPPYQYVGGNPINLIDPSGFFPEYCRKMNSKHLYKRCVLDYYNIEPYGTQLMEKEEQKITGSPGCDLGGPIFYKAPGYLEGNAFGLLPRRYGAEIVYDFGTMERHEFYYEGDGGNDSMDIGINLSIYAGRIDGFSSIRPEMDPEHGIIKDYSGPFDYYALGGTPEVWPALPYGIGAGIIKFNSPDHSITGYNWYVGGGVSGIDLIPYTELDAGRIDYIHRGTRKSYTNADGVYLSTLMADLLSGAQSPWGGSQTILAPFEGLVSRVYAVGMAIKYAEIYEEINTHSKNSN